MGYDPKDIKGLDDAVGNVDIAARELAEKINSLSRSGESVVAGGYRANSAAATMDANGSGGSKDKKRREENAHLQQLMMLNDQLTAIDIRRSDIDDMMKGIDDTVAAIDRGETLELDEDGSLKNKAAEKALSEYEKKFGKKIDRNDPEAVRIAMLTMKPILEAENNELGTKRQNIIEQRERHEQNPTADSATDLARDIELSREARLAHRRQLEIQETKIIADQSVVHEVETTADEIADVDEIVGEFVRDVKLAQDIEDPIARLAKERELIEALPDGEASEFVQYEADTKHLFEPEYFDALDRQEISTATTEPNRGLAPPFSI